MVRPLLFSGILLGLLLPLSAADAADAQNPADSARPAAAAEVPADSAKPAPDTVKAAEQGTADSTTLQARLYEYIAHPVLQVITWPVEKGLVPVVKLAIYPTKAPLKYALRENVIDRTIQLISFGDKEQIMLYPTLNLAPGTGSFTGLTLRHGSLFGRQTERLVAMGSIFVNGDWRFRSYLSISEMLGTGFDGRVTLQFNRMKNTNLSQPGTNSSWSYADSSNVVHFSLAHNVVEQIGAKATYVFRDNHFAKAPPGGDPLVSDFFRNDSGRLDPGSRGLEKDWHDHILAFGFFRDSRNNENIPLTGSNFSISGRYHLNNEDHDFAGWESIWTGYYKLGRERYEITAEEERKAGGMNMRKVLKSLEMRKLRSQIFNRKVLALHAYAAQSFEVGGGNRMPAYGLMTLGNDTPMRGYGGSRFRDYTVASLGAEYRFPVVRLMDGIIFNEYGVFGRSWEKIDWSGSLKNSWGFGINVRRPDIFLFRVHAGFHGLHGIQLNMSVDTNY